MPPLSAVTGDGTTYQVEYKTSTNPLLQGWWATFPDGAQTRLELSEFITDVTDINALEAEVLSKLRANISSRVPNMNTSQKMLDLIGSLIRDSDMLHELEKEHNRRRAEA